jgi:hypothetical protein
LWGVPICKRVVCITFILFLVYIVLCVCVCCHACIHTCTLLTAHLAWRSASTARQPNPPHIHHCHISSGSGECVCVCVWCVWEREREKEMENMYQDMRVRVWECVSRYACVCIRKKDGGKNAMHIGILIFYVCVCFQTTGWRLPASPEQGRWCSVV